MIFRVLLKALTSHYHTILLLALGFVLIVLPLFGVHVSQFVELIGGNYTNVVSAVAAAIAASAGVSGLALHHETKTRQAQVSDALSRIESHLFGDAGNNVPERPVPGSRGHADPTP